MAKCSASERYFETFEWQDFLSVVSLVISSQFLFLLDIKAGEGFPILDIYDEFGTNCKIISGGVFQELISKTLFFDPTQPQLEV